MTLLRTLLFVLGTLTVVLRGAEARAAISVVTTTSDLAAIARQIGGPRVTVGSLAVPTQDPHFVDAKPSLALALNRADALFVQGLELEVGWLPTLQVGARNPKIQDGGAGYFDCSTVVPLLDVPSAEVTRAQGDVHRRGNPHYLHDPRNGAKVASAMAARLAAIDPSGAADFARAARDIEAGAEALASEMQAKFAALDPARRKIVVYHRSFPYLEAWLGLTEVGAVEPKPGIPPDPAHVAALMVEMRGKGVRAVLSESYYPQTTSKLLADRTGALLVVVPGSAGGESYLERVRGMAQALYEALAR